MRMLRGVLKVQLLPVYFVSVAAYWRSYLIFFLTMKALIFILLAVFTTAQAQVTEGKYLMVTEVLVDDHVVSTIETTCTIAYLGDSATYQIDCLPSKGLDSVVTDATTCVYTGSKNESAVIVQDEKSTFLMFGRTDSYEWNESYKGFIQHTTVNIVTKVSFKKLKK